jgi:hypothetical protein
MMMQEPTAVIASGAKQSSLPWGSLLLRGFAPRNQEHYHRATPSPVTPASHKAREPLALRGYNDPLAKIFFIHFVDVMFTTLFERLFTKSFDHGC